MLELLVLRRILFVQESTDELDFNLFDTLSHDPDESMSDPKIVDAKFKLPGKFSGCNHLPSIDDRILVL